jgi:adenine-specific DNA-methyltransferase
MVKKPILQSLLNNYDPTLIETHLVDSFLNKNKLLRDLSPVLTNYFQDFSRVPLLSDQVTQLNISSLKELENHLEYIIPEGDRKLNGAFFTPDFIIDFVINTLQPKKSDANFDPSCGCGAFLIGLTDYYYKKFNQSIRKTIQGNIFGCDILDYNIKRTKILLSIRALEQNEFLEEADFNLWNLDSLRAKWDRKFDVILSNPPYVKFQDLSNDNRAYLAGNWKTVEGGCFNLYFPFFELGHQLLNAAGRLAYITPNNYFTSISAESLRKYFHLHQCVSRIVDFSHQKVFGAQTYTAITFLNKQPNPSLVFDKISDSQNPESFLAKANGSLNLLSQLNAKKWRLLKTEDQQNIKVIEGIGTPIGKLFEISAGIATLKDDLFYIDGRQHENDYFVKHTVYGKFKIEKAITWPVYKISDFKNQSDVGNNRRRIICPYRIDRGSAIAITETELKDEFPKCYQYLLSEKETLRTRDKAKVRFHPFFAWGRTQGITKFGKRILTPTFSRKPRFLMVGTGRAYFTNGYGLSPRTTKIVDNEEAVSPANLALSENIDIVQRILNSVVMQYYISKTSVSIAGGYGCFQKNFIERFSIPPLSQAQINLIRLICDDQRLDEMMISLYELDLSEIPSQLRSAVSIL